MATYTSVPQAPSITQIHEIRRAQDAIAREMARRIRPTALEPIIAAQRKLDEAQQQLRSAILQFIRDAQ